MPSECRLRSLSRALSLSVSLTAHPRLEEDVDVDVGGVRRPRSRTRVLGSLVPCHEDNDVAAEASEVNAMRPDLSLSLPEADSYMPINHAR